MNLNELIKQAEEAGADFKKVLIPDSTYRCECTHLNYKESKAGNPGFGVRFKVLEGPHTNKAFWTNFYLTPTKKDGTPNNAGVSIFFRQLDALGFSVDEFKAGLKVEAAVTSGRGIGTVVDVDTETNTYKDESETRAKKIKKVSSDTPAPPVVASATTATPEVVAPPVTISAPLPSGQTF